MESCDKMIIDLNPNKENDSNKEKNEQSGVSPQANET